MKTFACIIIFLVIQLHINAGTQVLKIGDHCPDLELREVVNYKTTTVHISDFKGQLLILDFWSVHCAPCVMSFGKMDTIEKKFTGRVQIFPVTADDEQNVRLLFDKLSLVKHIQPFSAVNDIVLSRVFPSSVVPHFVWIDGDGIIVKITGDEEINEKNMNDVLDSSDHRTKQQTDEAEYKLPEFLIANPLIADTSKIEKINNDKVFVQSLLTRHVDGIWGSVNIDTNSVTLANTDIQWLYQVAFMKYGNGMNNRIAIDIKDSALYKSITPNTKDYIPSGKPYDEWAQTNTYCYHLHVPLAMASEKFDIMLDELNRDFGLLKGIEGKVENRKMNCLVLVRTTRDDKLATKHTSEEVADNRFFLHLQNASFSLLILKLANYYMQLSPLPILDETGYTGKVDLDITADLSDVNAVNAELKKYGLEFRQEEKEIKMMVLRKKD